jgi:hypothetical protein
MPTQSSLAAGVLQTSMRISISVGLGITAAVYGSVTQTPEGRANVNLPFERAYLCSIMFAVTGLLFVPFMKIGRQGRRSPPPSITGTTMVEEERPRTGGEYSDDHPSSEHRHIIGNKPSQTSLWSSATAGSVDSFFPRWSWEGEIAWPDDRYRPKSSNVVYEVCVNCLEERRVVVQDNHFGAHRHRHHTMDPNPFRHIDENSYDDPAVDSPNSNAEAKIIRHGTGNGSLSSAETLYANTDENVHPALSRMPPRRGLSSSEAGPPSLHQAQRSVRNPNRYVQMTGALQPNTIYHRDPEDRVSRGGRGWV